MDQEERRKIINSKVKAIFELLNEDGLSYEIAKRVINNVVAEMKRREESFLRNAEAKEALKED